MSFRQGIETRAGGQLFRSRLEAKWAMFFDKIGWRWTYEPFDADYYIPDFLIHGDEPFLVEVKPYATSSELDAEAYRVARATRDVWTGDILAVGANPQIESANDSHGSGFIAGTLLERSSDHRRSLDVAMWFRCCDCDQIGIHADEGWYAGRPCGHYWGTGHLRPVDGGRNWNWGDFSKTIEMLWREAGNEVKWQPKS